jgi:prophage endopeptidase
MPIWLTALPWRFLSGLACGALVVWLWHDASVSRIELKQAEGRAQATLSQSIAITQADAKASKELSDAKAVTNDLARNLAGGTKRLRIGATCVPVAGGSGVDDGKFAILNRVTEQSYLAHRDLIQRKDAQIAGLQGIIRGLQNGTK